MDTLIVVAIITACSTIALKFIEKWLERRDPVVRQRDYRAEITELTERVDHLESEVETWRTKAFKYEEEVVQLRKELHANGLQPPSRAMNDFNK